MTQRDTINHTTLFEDALRRTGPDTFEVDTRELDHALAHVEGDLTVGGETIAQIDSNETVEFTLGSQHPNPVVSVGGKSLGQIRNRDAPLFAPGAKVGNPSNVTIRDGEIVDGPPSGQEVTLVDTSNGTPVVKFGETPAGTGDGITIEGRNARTRGDGTTPETTADATITETDTASMTPTTPMPRLASPGGPNVSDPFTPPGMGAPTSAGPGPGTTSTGPGGLIEDADGGIIAAALALIGLAAAILGGS